MSTVRLSKHTHEDYVRRLKSSGEEGLYRFAVGQGVIAKTVSHCPDLDLLNQAESFFSLYRNNGDDRYFVIGRVLRKAAHRLHRAFMKKEQNYPSYNNRFITLVK